MCFVVGHPIYSFLYNLFGWYKVKPSSFSFFLFYFIFFIFPSSSYNSLAIASSCYPPPAANAATAAVGLVIKPSLFAAIRRRLHSINWRPTSECWRASFALIASIRTLVSLSRLVRIYDACSHSILLFFIVMIGWPSRLVHPRDSSQYIIQYQRHTHIYI
jgi:hypothetical protein